MPVTPPGRGLAVAGAASAALLYLSRHFGHPATIVISLEQ
jgi:hypothetical protein